MCKVLKVSRSCYYNWIHKGSRGLKVDKQLNDLIKDLFIHSRQTYGTRRLKESLVQNYGLVVSRKLITKMMRSQNLKVKMKRRFKVTTTNSNHNFTIAPNRINRDFYSSIPNDKYIGDITYIKTNQGTLYLATVINLYSRKVVGWSMDDTMKTKLVNDALIMAIKRRKPDKGLIWHTDRGSQYASDSHKNLLKEYGIVQSMSRKGDCWDNAVSESFFHSLKTELVYHETFKTKAQANEMIFEYIIVV